MEKNEGLAGLPKWRKMRVSQVFPSEDGLVRKVEVTNRCGKFYVRHIAKLVPIVL